MGCAQTRDKNDEYEIETHENNLHFSDYTISQIKQAFFIPSGPDTINQNQLHKAMEQLGIHYTQEEKGSYNMFISAFQSNQNETMTFYNLKNLLLAIFMLSKSNQHDKAVVLFDFFDENASKKITREDLEKMLVALVEVVFNYSEKFLDNEEGVVQAHHEIIDIKEEEVMPKLFRPGFTATSIMTKADFLKWMEKTGEDIIDFTNPKSIRKVLMDFVLHSKKTQVELQQMYKIRQKKEENLNEQEHDKTGDNTGDNTPLQNSK